MNGSRASVTLPTKVAPGDSLVRHEIIALHLATTLGGAEFYPSYTQFLVGDSQTDTPNETLSFPGVYNNNDPGIYDPNVYTQGAPYTIPGGPVSNLASAADMTGQLSGNGSSSTSVGSSYPSSTAKNGKPMSTDGAGSGSGSGVPAGIAQSPLRRVCKLQKRDSQRDTGMVQHPIIPDRVLASPLLFTDDEQAWY